MCRTEVATRPTVAGREDPGGVERDASTSAASFRVREYEARDEDGIYALEHKSQMENPISRLVKIDDFLRVVEKRNLGYDAKARDFDTCVILVAEDPGGSIIGVVNVGIKDVILEGRESRVGFLYGMRVHQNSQKLGVGGRLLEEAERRSISKGCCRMLLTINGDNKKARSFFDKKGFCTASGRKLEFHLLNNVTKETPPALAHLVKFHPGNDDPAALATLAKFHEGRELSPVRMDSIATREPFLGIITATSEDGKSHAGGMMWNASHLATFTFHGLIPDLVRSKPYFFITRGVAGIALAAWTANIIRMCVEERYVRASLSTLVVGALVYGLSRIYGAVSFVASRNLKKLRFFGHYASGDQGEQLLRAVFWKARQLACCEFQGGFMILNNDVVEPRAAAFKAPRDRGLAGWLRRMFGRRNAGSEYQREPDSLDSAKKLKEARTFFLHKTLMEGGPGLGSGSGQPALGLLSPDMFFDPRDI